MAWDYRGLANRRRPPGPSGTMTTIAGSTVSCARVPQPQPRLLVVLLHGYGMQAGDLLPFASVLPPEAACCFPQATIALDDGGWTWWPVDRRLREASLRAGPRDLHDTHPPGREAARAQVAAVCRELRARHPGLPLLLGGFSQGGMLACETVLHGDCQPQGLALLSASRIAFDEWQPLGHRLRGLPVLQAHGESDGNVSHAAAVALRGFLQAAGAQVDWLSFDGGHGLPLPVWRRMKRFAQTLLAPSAGD